MSYKEKIEFKKEIKECMLFDGENYSLNKKQLDRIILQYEMDSILNIKIIIWSVLRII